MTVPATPQEPSAFVRRLWAGEQLPLPADSVTAWQTCCNRAATTT
ncbi:hypothetical protein [Streptomyces canus]